MLSSAKLKANLYPLILLAVCAAAPAWAEDADRCTGTLCDLYYGGPPSPQPATKTASAPASKPLLVPNGFMGHFVSGSEATQAPASGGTAAGTPAPATRRLVGVGGGGLAAMARGEKQERCTGTLCDLYYGGPPPESAQNQSAGTQSQPVAVAPRTAEASVEAYPNDASRSAGAASAEGSVRYAPPRCFNAQDPWKCYR